MEIFKISKFYIGLEVDFTWRDFISHNATQLNKYSKALCIEM